MKHSKKFLLNLNMHCMQCRMTLKVPEHIPLPHSFAELLLLWYSWQQMTIFTGKQQIQSRAISIDLTAKSSAENTSRKHSYSSASVAPHYEIIPPPFSHSHVNIISPGRHSYYSLCMCSIQNLCPFQILVEYKCS